MSANPFTFSQETPIKKQSGTGGTKFIEQIINRGKLIVAMVNNDQPPFFFTDENGELQGFDVELAKGMADKLNVLVEYDRSANTFNDLIPLVASGKVDMVISKLSRTLDRSQKVLFSTPYLRLRQAILFNQLRLAKIARSEEETVQMIKNYNIQLGVIANSSYVTYAKLNFPEAEIITFPNWSSAIVALNEGKVPALYRDEMEIRRIINSDKKSRLALKPIFLSDTEDAIAIALHPDAVFLQNWVNLYLELNFKKPINIVDLLNTYNRSE